MKKTNFLVILVAVIMAVSVVSAATLSVPGDYTTIQAAINAAVSGDTILVADGTYIENIAITGKSITLLSVNGKDSTTIQGLSTSALLGTIVVTGSTTGLQIGYIGQGFKIIGIDSASPGLEKAAVYASGTNTNLKIIGNEIVANGDYGLLTGYGAAITNAVIDSNIFSGQSFIGSNPAGNGFSAQFTLWNVPRQLVTMGGGAGNLNIVFTNNKVIGKTGGYNTLGQEQGNQLVTIDAVGTVIKGNTFNGVTSRFATSLRSRRLNTVISENNFISTGLTPTVAHMYIENSPRVEHNNFDLHFALSGKHNTNVTLNYWGTTNGSLIASLIVMPGFTVTYQEWLCEPWSTTWVSENGVCVPRCTPTGISETICNGLDDDCDSAIDEDYINIPTSCGVGVCLATGQMVCNAGAESNTCIPGTPIAEICGNGLDEDCNGVADNGCCAQVIEKLQPGNAGLKAIDTKCCVKKVDSYWTYDDPTSDKDSHGDYVRCVVAEAKLNGFTGKTTPSRGDITQTAAKSNINMPETSNSPIGPTGFAVLDTKGVGFFCYNFGWFC